MLTLSDSIHLIAFLAYLVKGLTGFGPAIIFISLGSLVMTPARVVAVSPVLDVIAGIILIWKDRKNISLRYWSHLSIPILAGVVAGALGMRFLTADVYSRLLGCIICILGLWFISGRYQRPSPDQTVSLPSRPEKEAISAAILSGVTGGLFGISGPPLIWYFGRRYPKSVFRTIIVPLFLVEAAGRSVIYLSLGILPVGDWRLITALIPALIAGLFIGNHWFNVIPQRLFERIVGLVLALSGIRLLIASL